MILRRSPCVPVFEHIFELRPNPTARPYLQYPIVVQERLCRHWTNLMHTCHQQITTFFFFFGVGLHQQFVGIPCVMKLEPAKCD